MTDSRQERPDIRLRGYSIRAPLPVLDDDGIRKKIYIYFPVGLLAR